MPYVITSACIDHMEKLCVDECPVDCIYESDHMLYINPNECVECGACEPACAIGAIYQDTKVPEEEKDFIKVNEEFFDSIGDLGGAKDVKFHGKDHQYVLDHSRDI